MFGTILGITLGTAINASINALINDGYTVSSYGNDVVYLSDVPQMNFYWPDAALYYNGGRLYGSQFTYTTPYYDMGRYNSQYLLHAVWRPGADHKQSHPHLRHMVRSRRTVCDTVVQLGIFRPILHYPIFRQLMPS